MSARRLPDFIESGRDVACRLHGGCNESSHGPAEECNVHGQGGAQVAGAALPYDPGMDPAVIAAAVGVGGTVVVGVAGYWASVRNTGQTIASARQARVWDSRDAQRAQVKSAITNYLKTKRHLQTQLYAREHGKEIPDIPIIVEQLWSAFDLVDVVCSEQLRGPLLRHAEAMNDVARHPSKYSDWWKQVEPYSDELQNAFRRELASPEDAPTSGSAKVHRRDASSSTAR
jgi:hypothetical protein